MNEPMIIILGAARSGTSMLTHLLNHLEQVVYIPEPKYIWKYKNLSHGHDMLRPEHLTEKKKSWIKKRFKEYLETNNGEILLEKTPSNSLRFEFVYNIFPDAKYVHIIRDGRKVAISARERWQGKQTTTEKRYRHLGSSISKSTLKKVKQKWALNGVRSANLIYELNYLLPLYLNNMGLKKDSLWGPLFPGIKEAYKKMDLIEVCALQWKYCTESVINFSKSERFNGDYFEIRYEDFVRGNKTRMEEMFTFLGLPFNEKIRTVSNQIYSNYTPSNVEISEKDNHLIDKHCRTLLNSLGYK